MEYRTIEGVELATVGESWPVSAGDGTFTFQNLADAVVAANDDPHIRVPVNKLGHESEVNGALRVVSPFAELGDAEPVFGKYVNLRLTNDGAALTADIVEVPAWLADAAPSSFPSRSIEASRDVTTEGGKKYTMVITAVSMLGSALPAVTDLDDLERFMVEGPDLSAVAAAHDPEEGRMPEATAASVDVGTIRQRFNWEWTTDNDSEHDTYWWWARSVRVDPLEIIADDDEGNLFLIPVTTDGKDDVTFGEPVPVREEFVPVNATATTVVATVRDRKGQKVLASNLERPEKPAPKTAASSQPDPQEDNDMSIDMDALRKRLGLPDDATEEQISEELAKPVETPEGAGETVTPSDEIPAEPEAGTETPATQEAEPVAASATNERGVTVDKDALSQLQAEAKAGNEARQAQLSAERDQLLSDAVKAGKFPPAAKASYREQLDRGGEIEASTRKFIEELPDNTVPVSETGEAGREDGVAASAGLPDQWFPELNKGATGAKED